MEQERPSKWNPQAIASGIGLLALVLIIGLESVLGSVSHLLLAILFGLFFALVCVSTYRRGDKAFEVFTPMAVSGLALLFAGSAVASAWPGLIGSALIVLGAGLFFLGDRARD